MHRLPPCSGLAVRRGALLVGLLAALALGVPRAARASASLSGVVVEAGSGERLAGALVELQPTGRAAVTDDRGAFRFPQTGAGQYRLSVRLVGYRPEARQIALAEGDEQALRVELSPRPIPLERVLVEADRAALSIASSEAAREYDLRTRPASSAGQLLQIAPGLVAVSHSGGQADQILLRGFDSGFGSDVAIDVDGVPANLVSHGHGQGYADLHFLIPELVARVEVDKGPYSARNGNLATAGHLGFQTHQHLHENAVILEGGAFNTARIAGLYQLPSEGALHSAYLAGDYSRTDGPFDSPQNLERVRLCARVHRELAAGTTATLTASGYASAWDASGLVPSRAVAQGTITRWGAIDDAEGGTTSRLGLNLVFRTRAEASDDDFTAQVFLTDYGLVLFQNLTYFLQDPIFGDMVEQGDHRLTAGLLATYGRHHAVAGRPGTVTFGAGLRADDAEVTMWQDVRRRRYWPLLDADVTERNLYLWSQEDLAATGDLRLVLGLRQDFFTFEVADAMETPPGYVLPLSEWLKRVRASGKPAHVPLIQPHASGVARQSIVSPKASLVYSPGQAVDLFANLGAGFHSNDARAVIVSQFVRDQVLALELMKATPGEVDTILDTLNFTRSQGDVPTLPRAVGAEVGLRLRWSRARGAYVPPYHSLGPTVSHYPSGSYLPVPPLRLTDRLNLGLALWWLDLEDELTYAPEVGVAEARGRTRRTGLDLEVRAQVLAWLWADLDANWAHGRLRDAPDRADHIPLAPAFTSAGGLTLRRGDRLEAGIRYRHLDDRPAVPDNRITARGFTVWELRAGCGWKGLRLEAAVENLFDVEWEQAQYALDSLLPGEGALVIHGPGPPREIHFAPGNPRNLRLALTWSFH
ncbi:MAG: TonB-dependent receptor [Gemmatimonadota bacterium]